MDTLDCKVCGVETECSEDAVKVTCSECVNDKINRMNGYTSNMELTTDKA
mgnify:FL=1|tara:strand:- start:124 stop:273 length:150 start_codon:yes stop_codon:yes gene_type:complete